MTPFPLNKTDRNSKILITMFLLTMLVAIGIGELNNYDKVWRAKNGVALRYGPEDAAQSDNLVESDTLVARMNTFSALLDVTHAHIFELPLVLFVLAHFLMRTRVAEWFKLANYLCSSVGVLVFLGSPWTVRFISTSTAILFNVGSAMIGVSSLLMIVVPLWDMWTGTNGASNG
jgi:hypothetical protein